MERGGWRYSCVLIQNLQRSSWNAAPLLDLMHETVVCCAGVITHVKERKRLLTDRNAYIVPRRWYYSSEQL